MRLIAGGRLILCPSDLRLCRLRKTRRRAPSPTAQAVGLAGLSAPSRRSADGAEARWPVVRGPSTSFTARPRFAGEGCFQKAACRARQAGGSTCFQHSAWQAGRAIAARGKLDRLLAHRPRLPPCVAGE